ncbi:conserved Plasmodium protein, unknown function [Plasmodium vinckei vinckei]|uniref:Uncharacterized protein n=1 Tax=Plasmodium vinckei vinckei TaxID=54757 RepID=A0A449BVM0_PLAVN|nr:conserved Plasmodium protein, unknown function [Plasmodium vinckei vinckei]VEV57432.1 conserved Plasmodium protein, unknown function [Plasmodium vinckei vinckei]
MDIESKKESDKNCKHFFVCNKLISQSLYICQFCKIKFLLNPKTNHEKELHTNDMQQLKWMTNSKKNIFYTNFKTHLDYQKWKNGNQNKKNNFLIMKRSQYKTSHTINICKKYFTKKKNNFLYKSNSTNIKPDSSQLVNLKKNRQTHQINNKTNIPLPNHIQKRENKHFIITNIDQSNNINCKENYNNPPNHIIKSNTFKCSINKTYNNVKHFNTSFKYIENKNNCLTNLYNYKICKKNNCVCYNNLDYSNNFKNQLINNFYRQVGCQGINNYSNLCKIKNGEKINSNIKPLFNDNTYLNIINKTNIFIKKGNRHDEPIKKKKKKNPFYSPICCRNYSLNCNSFFNINTDKIISNKVNMKSSENCLLSECMKYSKDKIYYIDLLVRGEKEAKKIIGTAYKHKENIKKYMYKNIQDEIEKIKKKEILIYEESLKKMEKEIKIYKNKIEKNLQNYTLKINNIYKNIDSISKYLIDKIIKVDLTFNLDLLKFYLPIKNIEQYIFTNTQEV